MNRLIEAIRTIRGESGGQTPPKSSKMRRTKRSAAKKKRKPTKHHQPHFYDPHTPEKTDSSSDEPGMKDLERRQADTMTRIEEAEAALAKERKRVEQLEYRRKEVEEREEQRRMQQDEHAGLTSREKNRRAFERAVARVERNALRKVEELERRFAHSDKVFELKMAREEKQTDERKITGRS